MIQIGRFQPRDIGRDLEKLFQNRQGAADEHGGENSVSDRVGALQADHAPVILAERRKVYRTDQTEGERK